MADRKLVLVGTFEPPSLLEAAGPRAVEFIRASRDPETETYQTISEIARKRDESERRLFGRFKECVLDPNRPDSQREYALRMILELQAQADFEDEMNNQGGQSGRSA